MGYPSFAISQDTLPADSYVGGQGRPSLNNRQLQITLASHKIPLECQLLI